MSSAMLEELEIKEPTPSIAPSQSENVPYAKKWRVLLAVLLGVTLVGVCLLGFYISAKARTQDHETKASTEEPRPSNYEIRVTNKSVAIPVPKRTNDEWRRDTANCLSASNETCPAGYEQKPLLVIGIDGVHPDFISSQLTPALHYLRDCGVTADTLVPAYPTTTFPNFYSIATGLYPESHGIIGNEMFDPALGKWFPDTHFNPKWWLGEPIWNTATRQNKKSAVYYWPGSDVFIQEKYPTHFYMYRKNEPIDVRTTQILSWLALPPEERPHIIMVYFEKPMSAIQEFGPLSAEAKHSLTLVDSEIDSLMTTLHNQSRAHCVNILVVSDHGAAPASCKSSFYLESFVQDIVEKTEVHTGAVGRMKVKKQHEAQEKAILKASQCKNPKVRVLQKSLLPRRYHYANNRRIEDIILDTKPDTRIVTNSTNYCKRGEHGFNNLEESMQATFIGFGPDLKVKYKGHSFRNVELYNLMCQLLKLKPSENNGTVASTDHFLRHTPQRSPPDMFQGLMEEEMLPLPEKRRGPENSTAEETCVCNYVEPVEEEVDYVSPNVSSNLSGNSTDSANATESVDYEQVSEPDVPSEEELQAKLSHLQNYHSPLGTVGYVPPENMGGKIKMLLHTSYVIGFHDTLDLGLFASFTITNHTVALAEREQVVVPEGIEIKPEEIKVIERPPPCWVADHRVERLPDDQCGRQQLYEDGKLTLLQLFPEELEREELLASEGHLLSNRAAARSGYAEGSYKAIVESIRLWATSRGEINVVLGPVFDYDLDGRRDRMADVQTEGKPLVPSDYFLVISACNGAPIGSCDAEKLEILAFVFPNSEVKDNCLMSDGEYLQYHLTTVRDVEELTGLRFLRNLVVRDRVRVKTVQPTTVWSLPSVHPTLRKLEYRRGKSELSVELAGEA